jgi:membrane fusion protein (multidrug efflux system)
MKKRMVIMLIALAILFGAIFGYKVFVGIMMKRFFASMKSPAVTVSTMKVEYADWKPTLNAVGSVRAIKGVNVTTELAGMVTKIYFTPGAHATVGDILVQLNADAEIGQLNSLKANEELARVTYERDKAQFAINAVSKATLDADIANLQSFRAQVAQQSAIVEKKTIRAPFSGRLGINYVNPGQFLNPQDTVATLQTLNPIYFDFFMPQQALAQLRVGQPVSVTTDTFKGEVFIGKITTINPLVDAATRNVQVEATIANPKDRLLPGMFGNVTVITGGAEKFLTVPQAAISFNSFGDIIYVVRPASKDKKEAIPDKNEEKKNAKKQPDLIAQQVFVTTGEKRGDQIIVLKGLDHGDTIVTSGQLKLKNGSRVLINNAVQPPNSIHPDVPNEHGG